jgi:cell division protease FtsH
MVTEYGMSEAIGPRTFDSGQSSVFLGKELTQGQNYSDAIAEKIDNEIGLLLQKAQRTAKKIIQDNRNRLTNLANRLISDETVEGQDLLNLLKGPSEEASTAV